MGLVKATAPAGGAAAGEPLPTPSPQLLAPLRGLMQTHWGHAEFRPLQAEAVTATLSGRDALVILPTGGGKSLTFQLAPLYRNQITVVVTPLLALAKDQVNGCLERDIEAAAWSSDTPENVKEMLSRELLADPEVTTLRLLYTTPESLQMERLRELLKTAHEYGKLCSLAIDEAHCVSEWGHDFRSAYLGLGELRADFPGLPVIAVTATATAAVKQSIVSLLKLRSPVVLHGSFNRPNIRYEVRHKELLGDGGRDAVLQDLLAFLAERRGQCGIVYARLRATCDWLAGALLDADVECAAYHAGKDAQQRAKIQAGWSEGDFDVVCATIAFGMGIDKACVRYVVHWDPPASVEGMYQESGRAGRDGEPCVSLLYASNQELKEFHHMERGVRQGSVGAVAAYIQEARCRRRALLSYFGEKRAGGCRPAEGEQVCDFCTNPKAVLGQLAVLEDKLGAAAAAAAAAASGDCACSPGSHGGSGGVHGQQLQQHPASKRRRSSRDSESGEGSSPGSTRGGAALDDPFASARSLAQQRSAAQQPAGAGGDAGGGMALPRSALLLGTASARTAPAVAGGAGAFTAARPPLKPVLPNRLRRPPCLAVSAKKQAQQQQQQGQQQEQAVSCAEKAVAVGHAAEAKPASPAPVATAATIGGGSAGFAAQLQVPLSAPAARAGAGACTSRAGSPAAATVVPGSSAAPGLRKPVFRAFKAPRKLAPT